MHRTRREYKVGWQSLFCSFHIDILIVWRQQWNGNMIIVMQRSYPTHTHWILPEKAIWLIPRHTNTNTQTLPQLVWESIHRYALSSCTLLCHHTTLNVYWNLSRLRYLIFNARHHVTKSQLRLRPSTMSNAHIYSNASLAIGVIRMAFESVIVSGSDLNIKWIKMA